MPQVKMLMRWCSQFLITTLHAIRIFWLSQVLKVESLRLKSSLVQITQLLLSYTFQWMAVASRVLPLINSVRTSQRCSMFGLRTNLVLSSLYGRLLGVSLQDQLALWLWFTVTTRVLYYHLVLHKPRLSLSQSPTKMMILQPSLVKLMSSPNHLRQLEFAQFAMTVTTITLGGSSIIGNLKVLQSDSS